MVETIAPVSNFLKANNIKPITFTINTIDGKVITGKILKEDPNFLVVETDQGLSFVFQSSITSMSIPKGNYKLLPQTHL